MELETVLLSFITKVEFSQIVPLFFKGFILFMLVSAIRQLFNHCFNYLMVRLDTLGVGSTVEYEGMIAKIKEIKFTKIILETKDKVIFVSIDDWRKIDLILPKTKDFSD